MLEMLNKMYGAHRDPLACIGRTEVSLSDSGSQSCPSPVEEEAGVFWPWEDGVALGLQGFLQPILLFLSC